MDKSILEKRVKRGARLLDRKVSNWFWDIDLPDLDMKSADACILGQSGHGGEDYWDLGARLKVIGAKDDEWDDAKAAEYGFNATGNSAKEYSMLAELWAVEVALRLVKQ